MRDIKNNIGAVTALAPQVLAATVTSVALDLQGFNSAMIVISTGAIASAGDYTAKFQESDTTTSGDFSDVSADKLEGSFPTSLAADSVVKVGYKGFKRYLRTVVTKNSGTSIAASAVLIKGNPVTTPVA